MKSLLIAGLVAVAATLSTPDAHAGKKDDLLAECRAIHGPRTELLYWMYIIRQDKWRCFTYEEQIQSERLKRQCIAAGGRVRNNPKGSNAYGECLAPRTPIQPFYPRERSSTPDIQIQKVEPYRAPEPRTCTSYQVGDRWHTNCY